MCHFDTLHILFRPPSCPCRAANAFGPWILYIVWECTSWGCQPCCIPTPTPSQTGACVSEPTSTLSSQAACSPVKLFPCCHSLILIPLQTGVKAKHKGVRGWVQDGMVRCLGQKGKDGVLSPTSYSHLSLECSIWFLPFTQSPFKHRDPMVNTIWTKSKYFSFKIELSMFSLLWSCLDSKIDQTTTFYTITADVLIFLGKFCLVSLLVLLDKN